MLLSTTIMRSINQNNFGEREREREREKERDLSIHSFYDKMKIVYVTQI